MIGSEIITEHGFSEIAKDICAKKEGDLIIFVQDKVGELVFICPCSSPKNNFTDGIQRYILEGVKDTVDMNVLYDGKVLKVFCDITDEKRIRENIENALDIIDRADREFDLVTVCSECGRIFY